MSRVENIETDEEFVKRVEKAKAESSRVVVDFTATWCGPCKAIAPVFASLSSQHAEGVFLKVDIDKCKHVAQSLGIRSIPTFHFYLGDTLLFTQKGADKTKLGENVTKLMTGSSEDLNKIAEAGETEKAEATFTEGNLEVLHDEKRCECLNDLHENPFANIFKDDESVCKSDVDEQLLFTLAYKDPVALKTIKFTAPDDGSGPKDVKLFKNCPNLGFSEAEEDPCTQQLSLTPADLLPEAKPIALNSIQFGKTDTITVFVYSNQGGTDQTSLQRVILNGVKT